MRRKDREVTDFSKVLEFLKEEEVFRIALTDEDGIFIVPLNYGLEAGEGTFNLYFHGAKSGRKAAAIKIAADNKTPVAFEIDGRHEAVIDNGCNASYMFASVMGSAIPTLLEGEDKINGLTIIMDSLMPASEYDFNEAVLENTLLCKLTVTDWSCKMH